MLLTNDMNLIRSDENPVEPSNFYAEPVSLHIRRSSSPVNDQTMLHSGSHPRRLRIQKKKYRGGQTMQELLDNRLKRFRMLDFDEFQEMLSSLGQHIPQEHTKFFNSIDSIGGMQLENYWKEQ